MSHFLPMQSSLTTYVCIMLFLYSVYVVYIRTYIHTTPLFPVCCSHVPAHLFIHERRLNAVNGNVLWVDEAEEFKEQHPLLRYPLAQILHVLCMVPSETFHFMLYQGYLQRIQ